MYRDREILAEKGNISKIRTWCECILSRVRDCLCNWYLIRWIIIIIIIIILLTCYISQRLYNTLQKSIDLTQKGLSNTR